MAKNETRYRGPDDLDDFVDVTVMPTATVPLEERYAAAVLDVARSYVGKREKPGNRGPMVEKVLDFVGWQDPAPYCSAGMALVHHEGAAAIGFETTCPRSWRHTLSASRMWRYARSHPDQCELIYDGRDLRPGDVVIMVRDLDHWRAVRTGRLAKGHAYLAVSSAGGPDDRHHSIEFNTNIAGSRNGDGVYRRTDRRFQDPHVVGAIRWHVRRGRG